VDVAGRCRDLWDNVRKIDNLGYLKMKRK